MKLPGDPWNNRWSSFYGIAWNFSMEFHRKCPNPPWKMSMQKFPWNSMKIGILMFSMEFHGKCPNPPCTYFPWKSMEKFPWNSMEIDVLILHGNPCNSMEFHGGFSHGLLCIKIEGLKKNSVDCTCNTVSRFGVCLQIDCLDFNIKAETYFSI